MWNKKKFTKPNVGYEQDSFWLQTRLILVSGKTSIPGSYRVIKNSVRENIILYSLRILPAFWIQHPAFWRRQICAPFGGREIAMTHRFPNSPLSFRYHDDESSRSYQFHPLHHEGPASLTICWFKNLKLPVNVYTYRCSLTSILPLRRRPWLHPYSFL